MTEKLDALVNDGITAAKVALISLEQAIAHERKVLELIEEATAEGDGLMLSPHHLLSGPIENAMRRVTELRLLVKLRRQAGRFVDDSEQHDGSDY